MRRPRIRPRAVLLALALLFAGGASYPAAATSGPTPAWHGEKEVFYLIFVRSFADSNGDRIGDFRGIEQNLQYLKDLGVTSVLLTPIVPSHSYHNYFASQFDAVDPAYGDLVSFRHLVRALHARAMKIYLDEEIQYVEDSHMWWTESSGNPASKYAKYILYNGPANTGPDPGFLEGATVEGYDGRPTHIAIVNLELPAVRRYFEDVFAWWAKPDGMASAGVDGFRIDHMMDDLDHRGKLTNLNAGFWAPLFAHTRAIKPTLTIIAEQADWQFGDDLLTRGDVDMVYAFPLRKAIASFDRDAIARAIETTQARTPPGKGQLIFIENHDTNRFASEVSGDPARERVGAALTVLLKGAPLIYYGQELGMKGIQRKGGATDGNDIPVRESFRWTHTVEGPGSAIWYRGTGPWWTDRYARDDDGISVEEETKKPSSLLSYYRQLLALRRTRAELREGDQAIVATGDADVLIVKRSRGASASLLIVNFSGAPVTGHVPSSALRSANRSAIPRDLLGNSSGISLEHGQLEVGMPAYGVRLLTLH
jgi:alpha-amylase